MGYKIREAQTQKIPYMLVVGDKEAAVRAGIGAKSLSGDEGAQPLESFMEKSRDSSKRGRPGPNRPERFTFLPKEVDQSQ